MGINWVGIVFGLGAVISMGYWTTDFLVVQRVISAKDLRSAKMAPIIGAGFKMMVPLIVILPGLLGLAVLPFKLVGEEGQLTPGAHSYNEVLPLMLARYCGPGLLGLGITALIAGFMSGMAGNVSAFATVWTYDIYRAMFRKNATDAHYVAMGRWCTIVGVLVSVGTAYLVMHSSSIMDYVQAAVQLLHRAAVRHGDSGHAVEARDAGGRFLGLAGGDADVDRACGRGWNTILRRCSTSRFRRMPSRWRRICSARCGRGVMCVVVTVVVSLHDQAQAGLGTGGPGLLVHGDSIGRQSAAAPAASVLGERGGRGFRDTEHHFLVRNMRREGMISIWFFIGLLLLAYGVLILGAGVVDWSAADGCGSRRSARAGVVGHAADRAGRVLYASVFGQGKGNKFDD